MFFWKLYFYFMSFEQTNYLFLKKPYFRCHQSFEYFVWNVSVFVSLINFVEQNSVFKKKLKAFLFNLSHLTILLKIFEVMEFCIKSFLAKKIDSVPKKNVDCQTKIKSISLRIIHLLPVSRSPRFEISIRLFFLFGGFLDLMW